MDNKLHELIVERLTADDGPSPDVAKLVLGACDSEASLAAVLAGKAAPGAAPSESGAGVEPPGMFLRSIVVRGFRGVGPEAELPIFPGPGLTLVVGRNGSGKSSFAEALELLFTGENLRWESRAKVFSDGWRNIHDGEQVALRAELIAEGQEQPVRVVRRWSAEQDLEEGSPELRGIDGVTTLDAAGWTDPLVSYRPFLSYNELGRTFDSGPTQLYETLQRVLGLGELTSAQGRLREARLTRERAQREATKDLGPLLDQLVAVDDERAQAAHAALSKKQWDIESARLSLMGAADEGDPESALQDLRSLSSLPTPTRDEVEAAASELRVAEAERRSHAGTDAARAHRVASLLSAALEHHTHSEGDEDCPVCGNPGALTNEWRAEAAEQAEALEEEARTVRRANEGRQRAIDGLHRLLTSPPASLKAATDLGIDAAAVREAWTTWQRCSEIADPTELADAAEERIGPLLEATSDIRDAATAELERREDAWRPVAAALLEWIGPAERALSDSTAVPEIQAAEQWLRDAVNRIRAERMTPIADEARANWDLLRQQSSVSLDGITFEGTQNRRRVELSVSIDGSDSSALGVMSQGELHSLALSLFLPRATLPESPFRFVVIDDPVQAMDPTKVDGLARVLEKVSEHRQVVVFTHDDRLPEAVRTLAIPARVIEVSRRANSKIELNEAGDPVEAAFADAMAAASSKELDLAVATPLTLNQCRIGIERASADASRKRWLSRGEPHDTIEERLVNARGTLELVALAIFDDSSQAGDVYGSVQNRWGKPAADALGLANRGSHGGNPLTNHQLRDTARAARTLAREIARAT